MLLPNPISETLTTTNHQTPSIAETTIATIIETRDLIKVFVRFVEFKVTLLNDVPLISLFQISLTPLLRLINLKLILQPLTKPQHLGFWTAVQVIILLRI